MTKEQLFEYYFKILLIGSGIMIIGASIMMYALYKGFELSEQ